MFGMRHATSFLFGEVVRYCRKDGLVTQQAPAIGSRKPDPYEQGVLKALSPNYEVTAVWMSGISSTLRIAANDPEEARRKAGQIWREETLDFLSNAEFETSELLRYEVAEAEASPGEKIGGR